MGYPASLSVVSQFLSVRVPPGCRVARLPALEPPRCNEQRSRRKPAHAMRRLTLKGAAYKVEEPRHDFRALPWRIAFVYFRRLFHIVPDSFRPNSGLLTTGHLLKIVL